MLQLREQLKRADPPPYIVDFNAWSYEKEEALWAAFALKFMRDVRAQCSFVERLRASCRLLNSRLKRDEGAYPLVRTIAGLGVIVAMAVAAFLQSVQWLHLTTPQPGWWGSLVGLIALLAVSFRKAWEQVGNPFERDLSKYFDAPDYRAHRAFIEHFSDDFANIVKAYAGDGERRIFVFIDDLDRCEPSRLADMLQAINLMLPSDERTPIVYILGLDREMVCAGIAVTFEKQLAYLAPTTADAAARSQLAMTLARRYVDKFVQVPFVMPSPGDDAITSYVSSVTASGSVPKPKPVEPEPIFARDYGVIIPPPPHDTLRIEAGSESEAVRGLIEMVAPLFEKNPRSIKQFVNVFRLQAHIAQQMRLFVERMPPAKTLTLAKLAKATAIFLRYPTLAARLREKPDLLVTLQRLALSKRPPHRPQERIAESNGGASRATLYGPDGIPLGAAHVDDDEEARLFDDAEVQLFARSQLLALLAVNGDSDDYRLDELDIKPLLMTVPATPPRVNRLTDLMASRQQAVENAAKQWDDLIAAAGSP
jgi:hypothetical protein